MNKQRIKILKEAIAWFKKQIEPHDCGWMYTTIDGLKHYIKELKHDQKTKKYETSYQDLLTDSFFREKLCLKKI